MHGAGLEPGPEFKGAGKGRSPADRWKGFHGLGSRLDWTGETGKVHHPPTPPRGLGGRCYLMLGMACASGVCL